MTIAFILGWTIISAGITAFLVSRKNWGFATFWGCLVFINGLSLLAHLLKQ